MSRHRSSSKKAPPEIGLHMECVEEELEPCQIVHYNKAETEYNAIQSKLDAYNTKMKAEVIEKGENCLVLQLNVSTSSPLATATQVPPVTTSGKATRQSVQATQNYPQVVGQGIITRSSANTTGNTYLVMDPRLGLVVGQVPSTSVSTESGTASPSKSVSGPRTRSTPGTVMMTTRARSGVKKPGTGPSEPEVLPSTSGSNRTRDKAKSQAQIQQPTSPPAAQVIQQVYSPGASSTTPTTYRIKVNAKQVPPPAKPSENNALGGLLAGSKTTWKPNSDDGSAKSNTADSREVTFSKMSGKTFPSLVVAARPHLRLKYIPQSNITQERTALDAKVKGVLMYTPTKFTEWLIQQGLIKSEQTCQFHVNSDLSPVKLKLGMYSDVSKFPYSGGYVWISECCPSQFVSVFSGSIFEGAPHPPTTILKLIYHWACQTNVQNVVQWVKVDNLYVKNFFTNMRAVCTQAIHQKQQKLGGPRAKIEVGVISLGTTSQDGNMRQVKVEVLGVMDPDAKLLLLRALEPISEERNIKRRFVKILEPLEEWVHKESTIFTDFTVDKGTLINMGFRTVYQISASDPPTKYSNQNVMEYLRRIVPRMFQNTLSLLSRQIIQQFLDELVWRETWGPIPSQAFVNIIAHIAEQTKLEANENVLSRMNKVASNPFKDWNYSVWKPAAASLSNTKAQQSAPVQDLNSVPLVTRLASLDGSEGAGPSPKAATRTRKRGSDPGSIEVVATYAPAKKVTKVAAKDKSKKDDKGKIPEKGVKKETEKEKQIPEEAIAFVNGESPQIFLDSYYYGTKRQDEELVAAESKGPLNVRCSVCNVRFTNNISLMKHMILHCQLEPFLSTDLASVQQCEYCFLGFNTDGGLKEHMDEAHPSHDDKVESILDCRICELSFRDRVELIYHMQRTHVEMELPYECGVCAFRTSIYKTLIDHFTKVHDGGEHILCPFCLKVISLSFKKQSLSTNIHFFENHLEKHARTTLTRKCHRCKLSFIHRGILEQHLEADHSSFKNECGVTPFDDGPDTVMMPEPNGTIKPIQQPKDVKVVRPKPIYAANKFKQLEMNGIEEDMACVECEGSLFSYDHFSGSYNCLKCRYSTCCERAMTEHVTIFHDSAIPRFSTGKSVMLEEAMYCVCGFFTCSGNKMAKHLAMCDKRTAYPGEQAAAEAGMTKDASPFKTQSPDGQNVLNMLGLVRKSPESGTPACDSLKRESETEAAEEDAKEEYEDDEDEKAVKEESEDIVEVDEESQTEATSREQSEDVGDEARGGAGDVVKKLEDSCEEDNRMEVDDATEEGREEQEKQEIDCVIVESDAGDNVNDAAEADPITDKRGDGDDREETKKDEGGGGGADADKAVEAKAEEEEEEEVVAEPREEVSEMESEK